MNAIMSWNHTNNIFFRDSHSHHNKYPRKFESLMDGVIIPDVVIQFPSGGQVVYVGLVEVVCVVMAGVVAISDT